MLVPDGSESTLRQPISSVGHRHREDRPNTWSPSVPRQPLVVFTMPPHTTALLILTHGDAADPIPSAVQHGEAAAAAAKTDTFIGERYRRLVKRRGKLKALVAVARSILVIVWQLLTDITARFHDLGSDYHTRRIGTEKRIRSHVAQLTAMGYQVTLTPAAA